MTDPRVEEVQLWVNTTYGDVPGFTQVPVTGRTGWTTIFALTRALQHELGITSLSDNFGTGTEAALSQFGEITTNTTHHNIICIVQCALWCKGYHGGAIDGDYGAVVGSAVTQVQDDIGAEPTVTVQKNLFKALLSMDEYVLVGSGNSGLRTFQRWLNGKYAHRQDFYYIPADGRHGRTTQKAILLAVQFELGMADGIANGVFGPGTRAGLQISAIVSSGSSGSFVQLFQGLLAANSVPAPFSGTFDSPTAMATEEFQSFVALPVTGSGDYPTWASLLVSTGDVNRPAHACDTATQLTNIHAATLVNEGFDIVGRYLTNAPGSGALNKKLTSAEMENILNSGLRYFPIFQTIGSYLGYFTREQGKADAQEAALAARTLGIPRGTTVYFAVDFDATDPDIDVGVLPYFHGIRTQSTTFANRYPVGVYGSRNVCSRLSAEGLTEASFVLGMSTGYSGNLGFPLPDNWTFDQIQTTSIATPDGPLGIDRNITSGADGGQDNVEDVLQGDFDVELVGSGRWSDLAAQVIPAINGQMNPAQTAAAINTPNEMMNLLQEYDPVLTSVSRELGIRKALSQTVLSWEFRVIRADDIAVDILVENYHRWRIEYEAWLDGGQLGPEPPPQPYRDDSSTGPSQIFGRTAIDAHNWAYQFDLTQEPLRNRDELDDVWDVWQRLNSNRDFAIPTTAFVLRAGMEGRTTADPLEYTAAETELALAIYNGADAYGTQRKVVYDIFESFNLEARSS